MKIILIVFLPFLLGCSKRYPSHIDSETASTIISLTEKARKLSNDEISRLPISIAGPADYRLIGKNYDNPISGETNSHSVQIFKRNDSVIGIWVGNSAREGYVALLPERRISEIGLDSSKIKKTNYGGIYVFSTGPD